MMMFRKLLVAGTVAMYAASAPAASAAEVGGNGLHVQPWFHDSFLEFQDDLADATADGKDLIVIIEQSGCPYCREMHEVNFARDDISSYIQDNFYVVQLDMWGAREAVDFDGEAMTESRLTRKWLASFTPTTYFFTMDDPDNPPATMREALVFTMPGYFKPFHHMTALEYVASDGYKDEPNFQRWLQTRADRMRAQGLEVNVWE